MCKVGYILKVKGSFSGLIKLFTLFDKNIFPNLAYEKYDVEIFENQNDVNLSAKNAGNLKLYSLQRFSFLQ